MAIKTQPKRRILGEEPIETKGGIAPGVKSSIDSITKGAGRSVWEEVLLGGGKALSEQFGFSGNENEGRGVSREETVLFEKKAQVEGEELQIVERRIGHQEYVREITRPENAEQREDVKTQSKIEELKLEIKQLISTSKEVTMIFRQVASDVTTGKGIEKPGRYHLNFFEWVLFEIRKARMRIDEAVTWMKLFSSKKRQRQYWDMFKKHGTTFGLSHERTVATQTG